jgi:hypothetical protein
VTICQTQQYICDLAAAIANGSASDAVAFLEDTLSKVISIAKSG